jgi:hypothetical protein
MFVNATVHARLIDDLARLREEVTFERQRADQQSQNASDALVTVTADLAGERARREVLSKQVAVQESFVEFLCSRVNQLETERVLLLRHLTSIEIPAPAVRLRPAGSDNIPDAVPPSIFDDDPRNAPAGWHPDGSVNYGAPAAADKK